jgi:superfamily I DNA and RNA helicase
MQNLYDKPPIELPGWVTLRADVNYRTPRDVLRQIGLFMNIGERVEAAGSLEGDGIDIATYADFAGLKDATIAAIGRVLNAGFKNGDIAVLTYCGRERSALMPFDQLGEYKLRRFDGTYDDAGNPVFQEGDILIETVFRFKGQSAPCIILTEVDFDVLDERAARRLYVGATRASMQLSLVVSERAASQLLERIT